MKRLLLFLSLCFICTATIAHTINWYIEDSIFHTTTCESGEDVTPPTAPEKYGYTFRGWSTYIPIEYLQGTGTQYIDTLFTANSNTGIKIKIQLDSVTNHEAVHFGGVNQYSFEFFVWDKKPSFCYAGTYKYGSIVAAGDFIEINWNKNKIEYSINDSGYYDISFNIANFKDEGSLYLFELQRSLLNSAGKTKIYYAQIYDNGLLVRDFIPVLDRYGTPCLYDKVEKKFYYNAGTDDFIAGPVITE